MNPKILDVISVTLNVPVASDAFALRRMFQDRAEGNNEDLTKAERCLADHVRTPTPITFTSVVIDCDSGGKTPRNIVPHVCQVLDWNIDSLVTPSFAQIGAVASFFNFETMARRMVPVVTKENTFGISWLFDNWPRPRHPVFRFLDQNLCEYNQMTVMLARMKK